MEEVEERGLTFRSRFVNIGLIGWGCWLERRAQVSRSWGGPTRSAGLRFLLWGLSREAFCVRLGRRVERTPTSGFAGGGEGSMFGLGGCNRGIMSDCSTRSERQGVFIARLS